jgi:putative oxidoreductase
MMKLFRYYQQITNKLPVFDGIPALLLRIYLAPVFIIAGFTKLNLADPNIDGVHRFLANDNIVQWFGNTEWGLGLPLPSLLANLAAWAEFAGGWLLLFGLLTRLVSIPLMFTMLVAMSSVHAQNGWFAITPTNPDTSPAKVAAWFGVAGAQASIDNSVATAQRLTKMRELLAEYGNTDWLYQNGPIVVLNNGIEFAATYFIMLLVLLFIGGGRFTSLDYYGKRFLLAKYRLS